MAAHMRQETGRGGRAAGVPPGDMMPSTLPQSHALAPVRLGSVLAPVQPVVAPPIGERGEWARLPTLRLSGKGEK